MALLSFGLGLAVSAQELASKHWQRILPDLQAWECKSEDLAAQRGEAFAVFQRDVQKFAPYWNDDFKALDQALGWSEGKAALLQYCNTRLPEAHECTSWFAMADMTDGHSVILHKNRDSSVKRLAFMKRSIPGKHAWMGMGDLCSLFPTMGINDKGLAVVMNSGDKTTEPGTRGFGTTHAARLLLEQCATADEAMTLLEKLIREGSYSHGKAGSIWFAVDKNEAWLAEHNAKRFAKRVARSGFDVRANAWHFSELLPASLLTSKDLTGNNRREFAVREQLIVRKLQKGETPCLTHEDMASCSRSREIEGGVDVYPLCGSLTNSAVTFVIDKDYPELLSTAWFAFGPPRHAVYFPVPMHTTQVPDELYDGRFQDAAFIRAKKQGLDATLEPLQALESRINDTYHAAQKEARTLAELGKTDEAKARLDQAFQLCWKLCN